MITDHYNSGRSQSFTIDGLDRITHVNAGGYGIADYTYDAAGNRSSFAMSGATSTYGYANNRLYTISGGTTRSFHYNPIGLMSSDSLNTTSYGYSRRSRLTAVTAGGTSATYLYNVFGERAEKSVGGTVTDFVYDMQGHLLGEYNHATGATIREYIWLGDLPLAQGESSGALSYIATDVSGTPHLMTDPSDAINFLRYQEPFGQAYETDYTGTTPLRFPGQYADAESGLNQNGYRDYAPTLGRYVEPDPIGQAGGLWPYGYAGQNPLVEADFWGLAPSEVCTICHQSIKQCIDKCSGPIVPKNIPIAFGLGPLPKTWFGYSGTLLGGSSPNTTPLSVISSKYFGGGSTTAGRTLRTFGRTGSYLGPILFLTIISAELQNCVKDCLNDQCSH